MGLNPGAYAAVLMTTVVSLFGLMWAYTATQRLNFLPEQFGLWRAHMQMIKACDIGDVVILGSSRAHVSFVPRLLGVDAVNLAMTSTTPIEAYYEARAIYRCPRPPKFVVLSFSGRDLEKTPYFWDETARFGLLDYNDLQEVAQHAIYLKYRDLYSGAFGSEPPPSLKNWLYVNHFPPYDFSSLLAAKLGRYRRRQNLEWYAQTLASRGQHVLNEGKCATGPGFEADQTSFSPSPLHLYYLDRLLSFLERHGAAILYVSTPMNPLTYQSLHRGYVNDYTVFLKQVASRHPGFRPVGDTFIRYDACDFSDDQHLNQSGAEKFSRSVAPLISASVAGGQNASRPTQMARLGGAAP